MIRRDILNALCILIALTWFSPANAIEPTIVLGADVEHYKLGRFVEYLEDTEGKLTLADVRSETLAEKWKKSTQADLGFGFTKSVYWVRFSVLPEAPADAAFDSLQDWILEIGWAPLDHIQLYQFREKDQFEEHRTGDRLPFGTRDIDHTTYLFPLKFSTSKPNPIYIRVQTEGTMSIPLDLWQPKPFIETNNNKLIGLGVYYGIMLVMIFYNLFLYVSIRDKNYLLYVPYISGFALVGLVSNGFAYQYLWPESPTWGNLSLPFLGGFYCSWLALFTQSFLQTKRYTPWLHRLIYVVLAVNLFIMLGSLVIPYGHIAPIANLVTMSSVLIWMFTGVVCLFKGSRAAKFYVVAFTLFLAGLLLWGLWIAGILPRLFITEYGVQIGSALEVTLLSLGLADQINQERNAKFQAQNQLLENTQEYERLVNNINIGIFRITPEAEGKYLKANPALLNILGYASLEELQSVSVADCYANPEERHQIVDDLLQAGLIRNKEIMAKKRDGQEILVTVNVTAVRDESGQTQWLDGTMEDITLKKEADEKVALAKAEADAVSKFLAKMSHEIRTPMNAILGFCQVALKSEQVNAPAKMYLDKIHFASKNLLGLLNDILDFSKIEAGKVTLEAIPFVLKPEMENLVAMFSETVRQKGIDLTLHFADDLPEIVVGDLLRLSQIVTNLISNAIKFTEQGSVSVTIENASENNKEHRLKFSIADTGIGIDKAKHQSLFDEFVQADQSTTRVYGGTGLGLSISKHLCELMGGSLSLESELGEGSTFSFTASFGVVEQDSINDIDGHDQNDTVPKSNLQGLRVLLVEDNLINQELASEILADRGIEVTIVNDGVECLSILTEQIFDIILMDMQMPRMDGITATIKIRENPNFNDIPILAMTANVLAEDQQKCRDAGMSDFLTKPFDIDKLFATIAKYAVNVA